MIIASQICGSKLHRFFSHEVTAQFRGFPRGQGLRSGPLRSIRRCPSTVSCTVPNRELPISVDSNLGTQLTRQPHQSSSKGNLFVRVLFRRVPSTVEKVFRVRLCYLAERPTRTENTGRTPMMPTKSKLRAARRGGFEGGGFPIWTCPTRFVFFVLHPAAKGVQQKEPGKKATRKVTEASEKVSKILRGGRRGQNRGPSLSEPRAFFETLWSVETCPLEPQLGARCPLGAFGGFVPISGTPSLFFNKRMKNIKSN